MPLKLDSSPPRRQNIDKWRWVPGIVGHGLHLAYPVKQNVMLLIVRRREDKMRYRQLPRVISLPEKESGDGEMKRTSTRRVIEFGASKRKVKVNGPQLQQTE